MRLIDSLKSGINAVLKNHLRLVLSGLVLYAAYAVILSAAWRPAGLNAAFWYLVPLAVFELGLRLALWFVFGRHYRYALFNFFLVDHPVYGFAFRKDAATDVPFLIFDKFVFKYRAGHLVTL